MRLGNCRLFFGGLSVDETAETHGISRRIVNREWEAARAWLYREMSGDITMKPECWPEVNEILKDALERTEIGHRSFLDTVCATDATLRREVEANLAAHQQAGRFQAGDFLDTPAIEMVATMITNSKYTNATIPLTGGTSRFGPVAPGSILDGRIEIEYVIGRGSMGIVYLARDLELGNRVVVKILIEQALTSSKIEEFRQEIELMARINHPGAAA